jgi:DNA-binding NarL/FixJ family response regulator
LRLLIVDDHPVVITGCRAVFAGRPDVETFDMRDGEAGIAAYFELGADLALIDINLPGASGFEVIRRIVEQDGQARLIAFSMNADPAVAARAIELGARA